MVASAGPVRPPDAAGTLGRPGRGVPAGRERFAVRRQMVAPRRRPVARIAALGGGAAGPGRFHGAEAERLLPASGAAGGYDAPGPGGEYGSAADADDCGTPGGG